jgi:hypothetical protein
MSEACVRCRNIGASWGIAVAVALGACHTDTNGLERQNAAGTGGKGGKAGGSALGELPGAGSGGKSAGNEEDAGETGPATLDVVHGLADGGRLFVCLRDGASGADLPNGAPGTGLSFAGSARLVLDGDLASRNIEADLFAARDGALGVLGLASEPSCSDLRRLAGSARAAAQPPRADAGSEDAGSLAARSTGRGDAATFDASAAEPAPNGLVRLDSVNLAAGVLHAGGRYALVATGCAEAIPSSFATQACGALDSLSGARLNQILVEFGVGSVDDQHFGLQYLNANRALASADLLLDSMDSNLPPVTLASQVAFGALRPRMPSAVVAPLAVEQHGVGGDASTYLQSWRDTLSGSNLDAAQTGFDYLIVSLGSNPGSDEARLRAEGLSPPRLVLLSP